MTRCNRVYPRRLHRLALRCVMFGLVPLAAIGAQTGQVVGVVVDQKTAQPLEGALSRH